MPEYVLVAFTVSSAPLACSRLDLTPASTVLDPWVDRHPRCPSMPGGDVGVRALHPNAAADFVVSTAAARPVKTFVVALLSTVAVPTRWSVGLLLLPPSPLPAATGGERATRAYVRAAADALARLDEHCGVACGRVPGGWRVCVLAPPKAVCGVSATALPSATIEKRRWLPVGSSTVAPPHEPTPLPRPPPPARGQPPARARAVSRPGDLALTAARAAQAAARRTRFRLGRRPLARTAAAAGAPCRPLELRAASSSRRAPFA